MCFMLYDVIIIGSGPSGLTAGIYTSRASLRTLLFAGKKWGGQLQLTTEVENFPGFPEGIMGPELMDRMRKQAVRFGVTIIDKEVTGIDVSKQPFTVSADEVVAGASSRDVVAGASPADMSEARQGRATTHQMGNVRQGSANMYQAKSIIIATGADTMWLGIPGEAQFIGKGVSSCAPCDAFFYRNKHVVVVGGGDSAMEEAMVLTKFASRVTVVHRRDSFRASKIMVDRVMNHEKIEVIWNTSVEEITGEQKVSGVMLRTANSNKQIEKMMTYYAGSIVSKNEEDVVWKMPVDGVFVAIGHRPNNGIFKGIVDMDEKGYIVRKVANSLPAHLPVQAGAGKQSRGAGSRFARQIANSTDAMYSSKTSVDGIFVSGDNHDHVYKQAITAAGFGCQAAMDVERWLEEQK